jgi:hypothetical protein
MTAKFDDLLEELDRVGARRTEHVRFTWEEARTRLNMDEELFRQAWPAFYAYVEIIRPGQPDAWALEPLIPPQELALLWDRAVPSRPAAAVVQNPWEIVQLDDPTFAWHRDQIQQTATTINDELRAWGQAGGRVPLPESLVLAGRAYKSAVRRLVGAVLEKTGRRLSGLQGTLPQSAYAELRDELYLSRDVRSHSADRADSVGRP